MTAKSPIKPITVVSAGGASVCGSRSGPAMRNPPAVVFFDFQHGVKLALFPREDLARDAEVEQSGRSATEFTLGHVVASEAEVDAVMHQATVAGA